MKNNYNNDEIEFMKNMLMAENEDYISAIWKKAGLKPLRALFLLEKWANKGWYQHEKSLDIGQLTEKGKTAIKEILES